MIKYFLIFKSIIRDIESLDVYEVKNQPIPKLIYIKFNKFFLKAFFFFIQSISLV